MCETTIAVRAETPPGILSDAPRAFRAYGEAIDPALREPAERL